MHINKKKSGLIAVAALLALALTVAISGCSILEDGAKTAAVENFMDQLNSSTRAGAQDYIHPDSDAYDQINNSPEYWDSYFPADETFTLIAPLVSGDEVSGQMSSETTYSPAEEATFTMADDGGSWKIMSLTIGDLNPIP